MAFELYPAPQTAPLTIAALAAGALQPLPELSGVDPETGLTAMFLRVVQFGANCSAGALPQPTIRLKADTGDPVAVPLFPATAPIFNQPGGTGSEVANATLVAEADGVYYVRAFLLQPGSSWQLQLANNHATDALRFTWAVADQPEATRQPWLEVRTSLLDFGEQIAGGAGSTQQVIIANNGTGQLVIEPAPPLDPAFQVTAPAPIGPGGCGDLAVTFQPPDGTGEHTIVYAIRSNDPLAGDAPGSLHAPQVELKANVVPAVSIAGIRPARGEAGASVLVNIQGKRLAGAAKVVFDPSSGIKATLRRLGARVARLASPAASAEEEVTNVAFSPDARFVLTEVDGEDFDLRWARICGITGRKLGQAPHQFASRERHHPAYVPAAFSADSRLLATCHRDAEQFDVVTVWSLAEEPIHPFRASLRHDEDVRSVAFGPGLLLATASSNARPKLWDLRQNEVLELDHADVIRLAFSPDGQLLITGSHDGTVQAWHVNGSSAQPIASWSHQDQITTITFGGDGQVLATTGRDGDNETHIWRRQGNELRAVAQLPHNYGSEQFYRPVAISFDSAYLATVTATDPEAERSDTLLQVWQVDGEQVNHFAAEEHEWFVGQTIFSAVGPLGRFIATASDQVARVWQINAEGLHPIGSVTHEGDITEIAFSPDAEMFATASLDGTAKLARIEAGALVVLRTLTHEGPVLRAVFDPLERVLVTAGKDGRAHVWSIGENDRRLVVMLRIDADAQPGDSHAFAVVTREGRTGESGQVQFLVEPAPAAARRRRGKRADRVGA